MTREAATSFDEEMMKMLTPYAQDGNITMQVIGHIVWGKPLKRIFKVEIDLY
jgi:hypothetical protein